MFSIETLALRQWTCLKNCAHSHPILVEIKHFDMNIMVKVSKDKSMFKKNNF